MAWLAICVCLLLWSGFSGGSKAGLLRVLACTGVLLATIAAVRVYPARLEALALGAGTVAAAFLLWLTGTGLPRWTGWVALVAGAAAGAFALFGPAQGLLP